MQPYRSSDGPETHQGYRIDPPLQTKRSSRIRKSEGIVDRVGLRLMIVVITGYTYFSVSVYI